MTDYSDEQIEALVNEVKARADAATPGPWYRDQLVIWGYAEEVQHTVLAKTMPSYASIDEWRNADFIAHAREDIPRLLDALASLQRRNADLDHIAAFAYGYQQEADAELTALRNENAALQKAKRDVLALCELLFNSADLTDEGRERIRAAYATSQPQENTP